MEFKVDAGGVQDRSQGVESSKPLVELPKRVHPGGMRETICETSRLSLASLWDAIRQWNRSRGFEDSTPGYVLPPLRGRVIVEGR